ncbi:MAG: hypothetical protein KME59_14520 [Trichormus sp. ATA11-4-KO1]|jgi:hypothetical protein|nr:hypothetical protein [Trichormus sp. ATA11-4-KO1]
MTHPIYSHQQLQLKSIARLKQIYSEIGCKVEVQDKRCKDAWINAIAQHQASKLQKVDELTPAQVIAPEELRTVEISFYDHEIYCGTQLIATISYDDDLTQPWVVLLENAEKFRANTWAKCYRYISWHHQDGTLNAPLPFGEAELVTQHQQLALPPQKPELPIATGNEIMAQISNECEKFGFDIMNDGIYRDNEKLGFVGCTDSQWWFMRAADETQQHIFCDSALEAVWWLSMVDTSLAAETKSFLDKPIEQLTSGELQRLLESEAVAA